MAELLGREIAGSGKATPLGGHLTTERLVTKPTLRRSVSRFFGDGGASRGENCPLDKTYSHSQDMTKQQKARKGEK